MLPLTRPQIRQFNKVPPDKDVLRLDVAMEDALPMHEIYRPKHLEHVELDLLKGEWCFLALEALVEVHVHKFEDECEFACMRGCVPLGSS